MTAKRKNAPTEDAGGRPEKKAAAPRRRKAAASEPQATKTAPEAPAMEQDPPRMAKMKKVLMGLRPSESDRIGSGDIYLLMNRYLQNDAGRSAAARSMGLPPSKCSICVRGKMSPQGECQYLRNPGTACRNGIIEWLTAKEGDANVR